MNPLRHEGTIAADDPYPDDPYTEWMRVEGKYLVRRAFWQGVFWVVFVQAILIAVWWVLR